MGDSGGNSPLPRQIADEAAAWVLRHDRGLAAAEQDEFSSWLAADPRHGAEFARLRGHWARLDRLAQWAPEHSERPNPDLLAPPLRSRLRPWIPFSIVAVGMAAAAVLTIRLSHSGLPTATPVAPTKSISAAAAGPRRLEDGTIVELNRGAELVVLYSAQERRVRLDRGEAHFAVKKDPARPFIVSAGNVDVRAVGTAFNVRMAANEVEVLVTEGRVQVASSPANTNSPATAAHQPEPVLISALEARQRAVISIAAKPELPQVATLTAGEIERVLAWQDRLLDFTAASLKDVVAEFNRRNVVQLIVVDPELASVRISAAFRSDNIDGFVHLLEVGFGAQAERRGDSEIVLRKAK